MFCTIIILITILTLSNKSDAYSSSSENKTTTATNDEFDHLIQLPLIPHHVQQQRRRRRRRHRHRRHLRHRLKEEERNNEKHPRSSPLYHGMGTHYVDLWIGTPPQRQTLIVDTGSGFTALPCSECHNCGSGKYHIDTNFIQNKSSTFIDTFASCKDDCIFGGCDSHNRCVQTVQYGEGSEWTANQVIDRVQTGISPRHEVPSEENSSFMLRFGCQTHLTGLFKTQLADGIMGMDKTVGTSYWKQAFANKAIPNQSFSLCYSQSLSPSDASDTTGAGVMTLGGTDTRLHQTPMVYANQIQTEKTNNKSYYTVRIKKIYLRSYHENNDIINSIEGIDENTLNGPGIILDSGTTTTHFPRALEEPFREAFKKIANREWFENKKMVRLTPEEFSLLPTILIQFEGHNSKLKTNSSNNNKDIVVSMPPSNYMQYIKEKNMYVPSISFHNPFFLGILGANFMMGHNILFDNDNHRIGFAESNCDYYENNM